MTTVSDKRMTCRSGNDVCLLSRQLMRGSLFEIILLGGAAEVCFYASLSALDKDNPC